MYDYFKRIKSAASKVPSYRNAPKYVSVQNLISTILVSLARTGRFPNVTPLVQSTQANIRAPSPNRKKRRSSQLTRSSLNATSDSQHHFLWRSTATPMKS